MQRDSIWQNFVDCEALKNIIIILVLRCEGCSRAIEQDSNHAGVLRGRSSSCQHERQWVPSTSSGVPLEL